RRAAIELTGHNHGRRRHVTDIHDRRLFQPGLRVLPEWLVEEVVGEERNVGLAGETQPIDHRTAHRRRGETIGVADDPARKDAAARATANRHTLCVDITTLDYRVDARHEIFVVHAGVRVHDRVPEGAAIAGRATRI